MAISTDTRELAGARRADGRHFAWLALAVTFLLAVILRQLMPANSDVSWLLTAGERMLAGERLYADVIEVNPPAAVLVYIPATILSHITGIQAEIVVDILMFMGIAASLGCVWLIVRDSASLGYLQNRALLIFAFAVLAILPAQQFAQREHIALLACLPFLAVLMVRANGETPAWWAIVVAGIGAGIMLTFKPHFAAGLFCAVAAVAAVRRSWRVFFFPEIWIAGGVAAVYFVAIAVFFPEFFTVILPLNRDLYIRGQGSLWRILQAPGAMCWFPLMMIIAALLWQRVEWSILIPMAASVGFAVAFFVQGKGWSYQAYPMLALAFLAVGMAFAARRCSAEGARQWGLSIVAATALLFVTTMYICIDGLSSSVLQPRLSAFGKRPAVLAITGDIHINYPLVRRLNGVSVSREPGLWVTNYVNHLKERGKIAPSQEAKLQDYVARERQWLIEDIKKQPPAIVLVDVRSDHWNAWLQADSELSDLLKPYTKIDSLHGVDILVRQN